MSKVTPETVVRTCLDPFWLKKNKNRWCVHVLRIVDHGLFELFAGWGANLHTSHMSCVMYACTVCGGPLARGGELGRKKSLVSSEHTHRNSWAAWMKICQVKSCRVFTGIWQAAKCWRCCENVHCKYMHILYGAPCVTLLPQCHFPGQLLI